MALSAPVTPTPAPAPRVDGDRQTRFRALFQAEFPYVWTSLRRLGVHPREVEDVAQEVFVNVYRRLDDYDPARPVRPWLFAFAFRSASDWRRLARNRVEVQGDLDQRPGGAMAADEALARAQDRELVQQALDQIDLDRRAVLVLYELDETPMKDIAEALGIPLFTAYSRLRVGRQELTTAIRRIRAQRGES